MKKLTFEEWIETPTGKGCIDTSKGPVGNPYLKNRLWWAFGAGKSAWDVQYTTEYGALLRELENRARLPVYIKRRIKYLMDKHQLK